MKRGGFGQTKYWQQKGDTSTIYEPSDEPSEALYPKIKVPPDSFKRLQSLRGKRDPVEDIELELQRLQKGTTAYRLYNKSEIISSALQASYRTQYTD